MTEKTNLPEREPACPRFTVPNCGPNCFVSHDWESTELAIVTMKYYLGPNSEIIRSIIGENGTRIRKICGRNKCRIDVKGAGCSGDRPTELKLLARFPDSETLAHLKEELHANVFLIGPKIQVNKKVVKILRWFDKNMKKFYWKAESRNKLSPN